MGFIIILIVVSLIITALVWFGHRADRHQADNTSFTFAVCGIITAIAVIIPLGVSYNTYLTLLEKQVTVGQYRDAVDMYFERGASDFMGAQVLGAAREATDLKYMSYQEYMAEMIKDLRHEAVWYNKTLTSKRTMKDGWMWNWLIYLPEELPLMNLDGY